VLVKELFMTDKTEASDAGHPVVSPPRQSRLSLLLVAITCLSVGIAIGSVLFGIAGAGTASEKAANDASDVLSSEKKLSISNSSAPPDSMSAMFARVSSLVEPSVVHIKVVLGDQRGRSGTGSGVIVNPSGYIITNQHVAGQASKLTVKLQDGTEYSAVLIGQDVLTDLAVIKIDPRSPLPAARIGNSDKLNVGDWVLAIGSPFGLEQTVTAGIISAKDRFANSNSQSAFQQFLQTDAAINPGNSGGPLVNLAGEVIGINTQIATMSGVYNGIGFAMPSSTAVDVYNQLVTKGRVHRGYLGVETGALTAPVVRLNKMSDNNGAVVAKLVGEASPASRAGLESGDVIIAVNGQKIKDPRELTRIIASLQAGSTASVVYLRGGEQRTASVKLEERKDESAEQPINKLPPPFDPRNPRGLPPGERAEPGGARRPPTLGINVKGLTPDVSKQHGLDGVRGVYVVSVDIDSASEVAGVRPDDVLIEINYRAVVSLEDFRKLTRDLKSGDDVIVKVLRRNRGSLRRAEIIAFTMP
jgi:serine protease Do